MLSGCKVRPVPPPEATLKYGLPASTRSFLYVPATGCWKRVGFDYFTGELKIVRKKAYSDGPRAKVNCYGADDVREGVAILWHENVDVSITGNSTNPTRFQHPVAGTYKKERILAGKPYFSVASGGGTGRTLHPDNMAAGPASYGMTDTLGRTTKEQGAVKSIDPRKN